MDLLESVFAPSLARIQDCDTHGHDFAELDREEECIEKHRVHVRATIKETTLRGFETYAARTGIDVYHEFDRVTTECRFCGEERTSKETRRYTTPDAAVDEYPTLDTLASAVAEDKWNTDRQRVKDAYVEHRH